MNVSVVICTYNRAQGLLETLESLRYQSYPYFEVVVVNGPSTDNSEEMLHRWRGRIRRERCWAPNLSMSRNIGIRASGGDIVAFIDDDALPDFAWLETAVRAFDDPAVGSGKMRMHYIRTPPGDRVIVGQGNSRNDAL